MLSSSRTKKILTALTLAMYWMPGAYAQATIQQVFFGINASYYHPTSGNSNFTIAGMPPTAFKFGLWRLNGGAVSWANIETSPGTYNWTELDAYVDFAQQHGADVIYAVEWTPAFYVTQPANSSIYYDPNYGSELPPTDTGMQSLKKFLTALATRYKGRIKYYEGWNEAGSHWTLGNAVPVPLPGNYVGTPEQLLQYQQNLYQTVKAIDPSCYVVSPAFDFRKGVIDMNTFLGMGAGKYWDITGFHFYTTNTAGYSNPPEAMISLIQGLKQDLVSNGITTPIFCTETGWTTKTPALAQTLAAGYISRAFLVAAIEGLGSFGHFKWDQTVDEYNANWVQLNNFPLNQGQTQTAAQFLDGGKAYQNIEAVLLGSQVVAANLPVAGICSTQINSRAYGSMYLAWRSDDQNGSFTIPLNWNVGSAIDILGNKVAITNQSVPIGATPVLLTSRPIQLPQAPLLPVTPTAPVTPTKPVTPVTPTAPVTPTKPVTPVTPTAPVTPTKPVTPVTPTAPVTPTKPVTPVTPTAPVTPTKPVTPVTPTAPVTPAKPVTPVTPTAPVTPTKPVTPVTPTAPVTPAKPVTPVTPTAPVTPAKPVTPVTPTAPVTPAKPVTPVTPTAPVTPAKPVTPVTPTAPVTPAKPVTPVTPTAPVTPTKPVTPVTPTAPPSTVTPPVMSYPGKIIVLPMPSKHQRGLGPFIYEMSDRPSAVKNTVSRPSPGIGTLKNDLQRNNEHRNIDKGFRQYQ